MHDYLSVETSDFDLFLTTEKASRNKYELDSQEEKFYQIRSKTPVELPIKNINGGIIRQRQRRRAPVKKWSKTEDALLRTGIMRYINTNIEVDYETVVRNIPGRSVKQAKERWKNSLNPSIRKGEWKQDELLALLEEIIKKSQNWTSIQKIITNRSMHCIKSKGRKLLGETLSKRLQKLTKNKQKKWTEEEISNATRLHIFELTTCNMLNIKEKYKVVEFEKKEDFELILEKICLKLETGRPLAQIDRKILEFCSCDFCKTRKANIKKLDLDFKAAWTKHKAILVKESLEKKISLRQQNGTKLKEKSKNSQPITPPVTLKKSNSLLNSFIDPKEFDLTNDDFSLATLFDDPPPTVKEELLLPCFDNGIEIFDEYVGFDLPPVQQTIPEIHPISGPRSMPTDPVSTTNGRKRQVENSSFSKFETPVSSLRKVVYSEDNASRDFVKNWLHRAVSVPKVNSFPQDDLYSGNEHETEEDETHNVLTMVRNYERTNDIQSNGLAKRLIEVMTTVYGEEGFTAFVKSMKKNRYDWYSPSICKVLDQLTPQSSDPRLTKEYLAPSAEKAQFDPFQPTGTFILNFVTKIFEDSDASAIKIARGDMKNKHGWNFVPGRAEAVLRLYYIMPSLQKTGKAYSHVRFFRCDGTMGVFLCHYDLISPKEFTVKIRFQDVSDRMHHILLLPDLH